LPKGCIFNSWKIVRAGPQRNGPSGGWHGSYISGSDFAVPAEDYVLLIVVGFMQIRLNGVYSGVNAISLWPNGCECLGGFQSASLNPNDTANSKLKKKAFLKSVRHCYLRVKKLEIFFRKIKKFFSMRCKGSSVSPTNRAVGFENSLGYKL
jgi:hypothetical protein